VDGRVWAPGAPGQCSLLRQTRPEHPQWDYKGWPQMLHRIPNGTARGWPAAGQRLLLRENQCRWFSEHTIKETSNVKISVG